MPGTFSGSLMCAMELFSSRRRIAHVIARAGFRMLESKSYRKLKCTRASGTEEAARGADRLKESLAEAIGISWSHRICAHGHQGNIPSGIGGICKATNIDVVEKVKNFRDQIQVVALL